MVLDLHRMWGPSCTQIFNMLSPKGRTISVRATLLTVATALQVCSEGRGTSFQHGEQRLEMVMQSANLVTLISVQKILQQDWTLVRDYISV